MTLGVTVGSRYSEVLLLRGKSRTLPILAVEGSSDSRAYRRVLDGSVHIVWLNGKDEVLSFLDRIEKTTIVGAIGIIDADHDRLFGRRTQMRLVFWTSKTDLESMVISSEAYLRATENGLAEGVRRDRRDLVLSAAVPLGCLRAASIRKGLALDFKNLTFEAFIDTAKITCDERACCEELLRTNLQCRLSPPQLMDELNEVRSLFEDPWNVVNGHDLCRIAQICSMRLFSRSFANPSSVFEKLAANYLPRDFEGCSTHSEIRKWQNSNPGFTFTLPPTS